MLFMQFIANSRLWIDSRAVYLPLCLFLVEAGLVLKSQADLVEASEEAVRLAVGEPLAGKLHALYHLCCKFDFRY